jgi:hypothetical protein
MKRFAILVAAVLVLVTTGSLRAQIPDSTPTPPPDPHTYNDPAMSFTAPPNALLLGRRNVDPKTLASDAATPLAGWVINPGNQDDIRVITILAQSFTGPVDQWEGQFESQTHTNGDALIKDKQATTLTNGMPAYFLEVSTGDGMESRKQFMYLWSDGVRGIVLSEAGKIDLSEAEAKRYLKNASATRYPVGQP